MSEKILMIETSTECCSVALADGAQILASRINGTPRQHAAMLAPYVQEVLAECGLAASGLDAVAVSEGPGSYTGLRVGVSTAKGLCFGAGKPLLGIDTLQILAMQALAEGRKLTVYQVLEDGTQRALDKASVTVSDESVVFPADGSSCPD